MHRRQFIGTTLAASVALFASVRAGAAGAGARAPLPKRDKVKVAFMLGEGANVIDTAGPWEVFQDTVVEVDGEHRDAFELYTVAPTEAVTTSKVVVGSPGWAGDSVILPAAD